MFVFSAEKIPAAEGCPEECGTHFEYRDTIAPYKSIKDILNKPCRIESHVKSVVMDGTKVLDTLFDFHAVYDIPIRKLMTNVLDLENEQNVFPRMVYTADLNPKTSLWKPHLQEVKTSFKVGGLGQEYHYIFCKVPSLREDGSFLIKWNLYKSIDGKFKYSFGSWYMKEITENGHTYTYVRNFVHYGLTGYPSYAEVLTKLSGEKDIKRFFKGLKKSAEHTD